MEKQKREKIQNKFYFLQKKSEKYNEDINN